MAQLVSAATLLEANDLPYEDVPCPEWGGDVRIRVLTGAERAKFEEATIRNRRGRTGVNEVSLDNFYAKLVVLCAIDAAGNRLFRDEDADALGAKNSVPLQRCWQVAARINGMTETAKDDAEK